MMFRMKERVTISVEPDALEATRAEDGREKKRPISR